jgi:hypothetical protein
MRKRPNRIWCHLSDEELIEFNRKVELSGMTRQSYLRMLISGYTPKALPSADYLAMAKQLHSLSNNVNQVAARANATGFYMVKEYEQYMNDVYDTIARIEKELLKPEPH